MKLYNKIISAIWKRKHCVSSLNRQKITETSTSRWFEPKGYVTDISVYNCISKTKVPFILKNPLYASWYMCGPTVYDSSHIGHACCYIKFDIIRRILLNYFNINTVMVMGITDIDDKIIDRAAELKEDVRTLTNRHEREFFMDMASLNVLSPTVTVRVTDVIPSIITFIQRIIDKGQAYSTNDGSVYFDTSRFEHYGKLFPVTVDETSSPTPEKKSTLDFALWKGAKRGEPYWPSPWGTKKGRPGWHIECSTIASTVLGPSIDLHTGGIDLLFPHHENEEAQSCAHHGVHQWVNYWLHSGHLQLKGDQKMSKSLKNTISIQNFLQNNSANQFRMFCLLSRYRSGVEYSDGALDNAKAICHKIESFIQDSNAYVKGLKSRGVINESQLLENMSVTKAKIVKAFADDFNTPKAINAVIELISDANKMLHADVHQDLEFSRSPGAVAAVSTFLQETLNKLGAQFSSQENISSLNNDLDVQKILDAVVHFRSHVRETTLTNLQGRNTAPSETMLKERRAADSSIMKACDQLRDDLHSTGIQIKDHGKMSSWSIRK